MPYKEASYWSVKHGDSILEDMVWGYMDPIPECPKIKGLLCFSTSAAAIFTSMARDTSAENEMGSGAKELSVETQCRLSIGTAMS
jgi:hypothetical protein